MTLMPYYWAEILKFIVPRKDIFKPCCNHTYFLNLANIFFFKRKKWAVLQIFQHFWNVMAYLITSVYNVGSLIFSNILLHWNEISINFLYRKISRTYISQIDVKILKLKYYFFNYLERNVFFGYFCSRTAAVFFFAVTFHCIPYRTFPQTCCS